MITRSLKLTLAVVVLSLACGSAFGASKRARRHVNHRPQYNGYYNGIDYTYGYRYDERTGWNILTGPGGGGRFYYRDGYMGPFPHRSPSINFNRPPGAPRVGTGPVIGFPG